MTTRVAIRKAHRRQASTFLPIRPQPKPMEAYATHVGFPYDPRNAGRTFSSAECAAIIRRAKARGGGEEGGVVDRHDGVAARVASRVAPQIRRTEVRRLPLTSATGWIYDKLHDMIQYANTRHWQFDLSGIFAPVQVLRYGQDHHFAWHVDAGGGVTSDRKISFTLQLSAPDAYVGGELELMAGHMPTELPRDQGIALLFPSYVLHRVRPVTNGERWALVGWVQGPPFR